jgi:DNA polymerase-3 subunit gamma/tau
VVLALYRRYRPGSFAEVVGQEHVTEPLRNALASGRIHHAYLFSGPRGCGKTSSARILARSLNCEQGPTPDPCGMCESCVALAPNGPGSIDVIEIDAASHGLVDDARDLRERAFFAPVSSRFKIYIIDEAHMVTTAAFNALLKVVEEPPPHLKFIFATTEPDKVIATIRSRSFHYPFRLIPPSVLRDLLGSICDREGVTVDPLVLPLVVRAGAGSARDALSVLDQLLAGAGPAGLTYGEAVALLGYTDEALLDEVVDAFAAGDGGAVFAAVDRLVEGGHEPRRFATDLLERLRDLIVLDQLPDAAESGLITVPPDRAERMRAQAARFGRAGLSRAADLVNAGLTEMRGTASPRLLLELICARVLLPAVSDDETSTRTRVERLERRLAIGATAPESAIESDAREPGACTRSTAAETAPDDTSTPPPTAAAGGAAAGAAATTTKTGSNGPPAADRAGSAPAPPEQAAPAAPGAIDAAAVRRLWPDVLTAVKRRTNVTFALLGQRAQVIDVDDRALTLALATEPLKRVFEEKASHTEVTRAAVGEVLGIDRELRLVVAGESADSEAPAEASGPAGSDSAASSGSGSQVGRAGAGPVPPSETGFDPGDEPADDEPADEGEAAVPADEAAISLLQDGLGAKVIGEVDDG